ncbi:MAG: hypothetical protein B6D64_07835 [Bacteroidetes bacterium 4484_276]|nr:MAG: hypothetical protein B6D64_07835 [Bacteroidetes bacterium 4484_276]
MHIEIQADTPPSPPPGHNTTGYVPDGGAPIGSNVAILLALGASYGGKKNYGYKKRKLVE